MSCIFRQEIFATLDADTDVYGLLIDMYFKRQNFLREEKDLSDKRRVSVEAWWRIPS